VVKQYVPSRPLDIILHMAMTIDAVARPTLRNKILLAVGRVRTFIVIVI
jgi:hypothetical protein